MTVLLSSDDKVTEAVSRSQLKTLNCGCSEALIQINKLLCLLTISKGLDDCVFIRADYHDVALVRDGCHLWTV